ncbi:hypothetical protein CCC_00833 [Paramagnetospirillum magnetotacticum MS-1]|uniref:Uncharacterized protein n=1 Tax=Paramagnetospirillum magnetotacticum MS-1 TaxID=272627 RepID=A0A0C2U8E1_PARME|nr:hypothetical protein CCC_00833 [Paramagnetospirillum magnetotacticum MS-1]
MAWGPTADGRPEPGLRCKPVQRQAARAGMRAGRQSLPRRGSL